MDESDPACPLVGAERTWKTLFSSHRKTAGILAALAALAVLPYLPVLDQPFVSDDYLQIHLARQYGAVEGWPSLAADPLYRSRATSLIATYWTEKFFGLSPAAFYATSVLLHVFNTWLVFAFGFWKRIGWQVSTVAAGFFAVYLGHQEAVMWYAALPGLMVFFFELAALLCWIRWVNAPSVQQGAISYTAALILFVLALYSKESAVVLVPIAVLVAIFERARRLRLVSILPFAGIAAAYTLAIFSAQDSHLHFNDGTFSIEAPFWITIRNSVGRMLWVWGFISLAFIAIWRTWAQWRTVLVIAAVWIGITILPFSFLTYMPRIPSRHTYLPSAGLALVIAAGFLTFRERFGYGNRWAAPLLATVIITHHCGYILTVKRAQFLERAEVTEDLLKIARTASAPIYVHCFPYSFEIAQRAVEVGLGRPSDILIQTDSPPPDAQNIFCPLGHQPAQRQSGLTVTGAESAK